MELSAMPLFEYRSPARHFKAALKKISALFNGEPRAWFLSEYAIDAGERFEPPSPGELPGLIFHHQLDPDIAGAHFISYWESRGDFEASRTPLEGRLGAAELQRAAWVRRVSVERKPFWKRITLYSVLLHIVAVLGALAALRDYEAWLFEEPMIALDLDAIEPINLSDGSSFHTHLVLTNQQANATAKVSDLRAFFSGVKQSNLISLGHSHDLGKEGSLKLPIRTPPLKSGRYRLEIQARGQSGLLGGSESLGLVRDVRVWSRSPLVSLSLTPDNPARAELKGLLLIGEDAPVGLDCFVNLMREPSLRFGPMEFRDMTDWPDPTVSRDGSVSNQRWTTPPLQAFSEIKFSLFVEGQPANGWKKVLQETTAECFKSKGQAKL